MTKKTTRLPINLWERLDALPPFVVRLLAKTKGRPLCKQAMSDQEISTASGLSLKEVRFLSSQINWGAVDIYSARAFLKACHVDVTSRIQMRRVNDYLTAGRGPRWKYILHSEHFETTLKPLLKLYASIK